MANSCVPSAGSWAEGGLPWLQVPPWHGWTPHYCWEAGFRKVKVGRQWGRSVCSPELCWEEGRRCYWCCSRFLAAPGEATGSRERKAFPTAFFVSLPLKQQGSVPLMWVLGAFSFSAIIMQQSRLWPGSLKSYFQKGAVFCFLFSLYKGRICECLSPFWLSKATTVLSVAVRWCQQASSSYVRLLAELYR